MKILFKQSANTIQPIEEDLTSLNLKEAIEKTRQALEIAYSGFDNAVDVDIIDSYIYEINALQKKYRHLTDLAAKEFSEKKASEKPTPYAHIPRLIPWSAILSVKVLRP